jgi:hypothetical protein
MNNPMLGRGLPERTKRKRNTIFNKTISKPSRQPISQRPQPPRENRATMQTGGSLSGRARSQHPHGAVQQHGGNARWGRMSMGRNPGRNKPITRGGAKPKSRRIGGGIPRPNKKMQYGGTMISQRTCGGANQPACPKSFRKGGTAISGTSGHRRTGATGIGLSVGRNAACRQFDGNQTMCDAKNCIFNYSERTCN